MSQELNKVKVLMINGDIEVKYDTSLVDASSINKEKEVIDTIVKKILKLEPALIITLGTVHRSAQESLLDAGVTLIMKTKESQFRKLLRILDAIPVTDLERPEPIDSKVLGYCNKF